MSESVFIIPMAPQQEHQQRPFPLITSQLIFTTKQRLNNVFPVNYKLQATTDILASVIFNSFRLTEPPYHVNSVPSVAIVLLIQGIERGSINNNEWDRSFPHSIINILVFF